MENSDPKRCVGSEREDADEKVYGNTEEKQDNLQNNHVHFTTTRHHLAVVSVCLKMVGGTPVWRIKKILGAMGSS